MFKVMVVDDDSMVFRIVKKIIPWDKYQMQVEAYAPNGEKAIEYLVTHQVDVVLVDLSMPHMGGLELIRRVCEFLPKTVFVILSSHSEYRMVKESFCIGAFDYLLKVDVDDEEIVEELLRRVTDKLHRIQRESERRFDFGDLVSKLEVDSEEKENLFYRIQVLKPDLKGSRLKIAEELFQIAGKKQMVYGGYEGYITILYYGKEKKIIEEQMALVNELALREQSGIEAAGNSEWGSYLEIEKLYINGVRNIDDVFWKIKEYFQKNYARPELSLQIVADEMNMSKRVLSKNLLESSGQTFKTYLNTVRIEAAKEKLRKTNMRVQEVAYATGYMNVEHFSRTFNEKVGCSPSHYMVGWDGTIEKLYEEQEKKGENKI